MENQHKDPITDAEQRRVPEALLTRLHEANQQLHKARTTLEQAMNGSQYSHQDGVNHANREIAAAEKAVEEITGEIHKSLQEIKVASKASQV